MVQLTRCPESRARRLGDNRDSTAMPPALAWNGLPVAGDAGLELGLIPTFYLPWNMRGL